MYRFAKRHYHRFANRYLYVCVTLDRLQEKARDTIGYPGLDVAEGYRGYDVVCLSPTVTVPSSPTSSEKYMMPDGSPPPGSTVSTTVYLP